MTLCILPFIFVLIPKYADETQCFKTGFDAIEIQQKMQADLVSASKWFETNAMCLNVNKI